MSGDVLDAIAIALFDHLEDGAVADVQFEWREGIAHVKAITMAPVSVRFDL